MNWFDKLRETFLEDNRYMWLVEGLGNTLIITFGALLIGVVIGTLVAVAKYYCEGNKKLRFISWLCDLYTTVIRGIPMTVLLLLFFFYDMYRGRSERTVMLLAVVLVWATYLMGPVMYARYMYPTICCLPLFVLRPKTNEQ